MIYPAYPEIVRLSAGLYRRELLDRRAQGAFGARLAAAVDRLADLLGKIETGAPIDATAIAFSARDLEGANTQEAEALINQWCLGWGRDDADVIVMGTEEAYSLEKPGDLAQWNCGCSAIWASGGDHAVVDALNAWSVNPRFGCPPSLDPEWTARRREFHIHGNDYFRVHRSSWDEARKRCKRPSRHTWKLVAEVLNGRSEWRPLLDTYVGSLGDRCYQIDVSAYPAERAAQGMDPALARVDFLRTVVSRLRGSARVLLFHGRGTSPEWGHRDELMRTFLGLDPTQEIPWVCEAFPARHVQPIWHSTHDGHLVVLTRALNGDVLGDVLTRLHELVGQASPIN